MNSKDKKSINTTSTSITRRQALKTVTVAALGTGLAGRLAAQDTNAAKPAPIKIGVILVNHVGFPPNAAKHCVIPSPPEKEFSIHRLKDTKWTQVFAGELTEGGSELESGWVGDFSTLKDDGIYQVRCGALKSRCFTVNSGVYDVPMRVLFNYFSLVRCGDTTGRSCTGPCHLDDGNLVGVGHRDFSGGYHQSSDLRKWAWGLNLGLMGLVQFGGIQQPQWDNGSIAGEVRWGSDFYQKLVRDDGGMFDSVFIPIHWGPRDYYPSDPPAPALWNNIRHQAMGAEYFKDRDPAYASKCRQTAERIWHYMTSGKRPKGLYTPPAMPPLGHEALKTNFAAFYENSAQDLAHRMGAALALYRLTSDAGLLKDAAQSATKLAALQVSDNSGHLTPLFREGPESDRLASSLPGFGYFGNGPILLSLCEMISAAPEHPDAALWKESIRAASEWYCRIALRNPWGLVATNFGLRNTPFVINKEDAAHTDGFYPGDTIRSRSAGGEDKFTGYQYRRFLYNYDVMLAGLFLNRAAEITGNSRCHVVAQRQLDWIMGCNPFDASAIEGVGYNQPLRGLYGEFFPPTPQIPGAVSLGLTTGSFSPDGYGGVNEYDMPIVGNVLWLMAEQAKRIHE